LHTIIFEGVNEVVRGRSLKRLRIFYKWIRGKKERVVQSLSKYNSDLIQLHCFFWKNGIRKKTDLRDKPGFFVFIIVVFY